jgi:hypothetical protein
MKTKYKEINCKIITIVKTYIVVKEKQDLIKLPFEKIKNKKEIYKIGESKKIKIEEQWFNSLKEKKYYI